METIDNSPVKLKGECMKLKASPPIIIPQLIVAIDPYFFSKEIGCKVYIAAQNAEAIPQNKADFESDKLWIFPLVIIKNVPIKAKNMASNCVVLGNFLLRIIK